MSEAVVHFLVGHPSAADAKEKATYDIQVNMYITDFRGEDQDAVECI